MKPLAKVITIRDVKEITSTLRRVIIDSAKGNELYDGVIKSVPENLLDIEIFELDIWHKLHALYFRINL